MAPELNERQRRLWAASEARAAGFGGIAATARATGISVPTIRKGIAQLESGERLARGRVRCVGAGRKPLLESDPEILEAIERLIDEDSRGDPESLLRWTAKSVRQIAGALRETGHEAHFTSVAMLTRLLGYSLQANVKTKEGAFHPDRDAQFQHINQAAKVGGFGWRLARDFCRLQEEGAGRRLQERRARVASEGQARARATSTTSQDKKLRQGDPLRRL